MTTADIIRRKSASQRPKLGEGAQGLDRAFRNCLGRAVRDAFKIQIDVEKLSFEQRSVAELVELVPDFALIAVLDGPSQGVGALIFSQSVVAGFIEAQTVGRVRAQELLPRRPTRTDGAMVLALIDTALGMLESSLSADAEVVWVGGFRFSSFLDDPRPLPVVLEDVPLRVLSAQVSLSHGLRKGKILLAVPAEGRFPMPYLQNMDSSDATGSVFQSAIEDRVHGASVALNAVLMRLSLPMADVLGMAAGMVLPLPEADVESIGLEGLDGRRVAQGKLGQNRGMRAVRLEEIKPEHSRHGARMGRFMEVAKSAEPAIGVGEGGHAPKDPAQFGSALSVARLRSGDDLAQGRASRMSASSAGPQTPGLYDLRSTGTD